MLYTGVSVESQLPSFIKEKNEELNGADVTLLVGSNSIEKVLNVLDKRTDVKTYESHDAVYYGAPKLSNLSKQDKEQSLGTIIMNLDETYEINRLKIIDEAVEKPENGVIVPYALKTGYDYQTGDELQIRVDDEKYVFQIVGFYENIIFASPSNTSMYQFFVYSKEYKKLSDTVTDMNRMIQINIDLKDGTLGTEFEQSFGKETKALLTAENDFLQVLPYETFQEGLSMFIDIIMVMLIAFSIILLLIALVVIRFSIIVHLEKNMKNIGSLEAIGYTTKQIKYSVMLEFFLVAAMGIIVGVVISIAGSAVVGSIVSSSIGLKWIGKISLISILIAVVINLGLIGAVTALAARRLKKITPLIALRSGIETHSFKRNPLPLEKSRFSLHFSIGLKNLLHNTKQNVVIGIIISLLVFAGTYAISMYYNFVVDNSSLMDLVGLETSEIQMEVVAKDYDWIKDEVSKLEGVRKVLDFTSEDMVLTDGKDESTVRVEISPDYSQLEVDTLIEGRDATHDNEIVVSNRTLDDLGLDLGDSVTVTGIGNSKEFLIVGVKQHINGLGRGASITLEGAKQLNPDYKIKTACIYLNDKSKVEDVIKTLNSKFKEVDKQIINVEETIDTVMNSLIMSVTAICILCAVVTIIIVVLILLLLIKVKILKEQTILGINKALGYTTGQLIRQILYSFLPVVVLGSVVGLILGLVLTNPFTAVLLASVGIMKASFITAYQYIILVPIGVVLLAAVTIVLVALRIRKITPNGLFDQ